MAGKRMLHENICESEKLAKVSHAAIALYCSLLTKVDDNGNFHADARLVKSACFPLREDSPTESVAQWIEELIAVRNGKESDAGLVSRYEVDGRAFLHFNRFEDFQTLRPDRRRKPKFPVHPVELGPVLCGQEEAESGLPFVVSGKPTDASGKPVVTSGLPNVASGNDVTRPVAIREVKRSEVKERKEGVHPAFAGRFLSVSVELDRQLAEAFPWVDRQAEYRKADAWLAVNAVRRPKNYERFIHNWVSKVAPPKEVAGTRKAETAARRQRQQSLTENERKTYEKYGVRV